jgi:hypothetical protein
MRSSSIKSLVVVSSVVFTLSLGTPCAEARPTQPQRGTQTSLQRAVGQLLRFFGIASNELPSDPIPKLPAGPATSGFSPTTSTATLP